MTGAGVPADGETAGVIGTAPLDSFRPPMQPPPTAARNPRRCWAFGWPDWLMVGVPAKAKPARVIGSPKFH